MKSNSTPKKLDNKNVKLISIEGVRHYRGLETVDFIYFCDYEEGVLMYDKKTLKLVSDNYFADNDMFEVLQNGTYTYASKTMKENIKIMKKQGVIE